MTNLSDLYENKYGLTVKVLLRVLGGDPDAILSDLQDKVDNPSDADREFLSLIGRSPLTSVEAADEAHKRMVAEAERLYFASIDRASAVAVCNALRAAGTYGTISVHAGIPELTYNDYSFMTRWNAYHPGEENIIAPAAIDM